MKSLVVAVLFVCSSLAAGGLIQPHVGAGTPAALGQFPWQVEMHILNARGLVYCSGALINDQWVVTSGDCTYGATYITFFLGSLDALAGSQFYSTEAYTYPSFVPPPTGSLYPTMDDNIGIVKLPWKITFNETISPVRLQGKNGIVEEGVGMLMSAWRERNQFNPDPEVLRYDHVTTVNNELCKYGTAPLSEKVVCALGKADGFGDCYRDPGAPLVTNDDAPPVLVGIQFFQRVELCEANHPNLFTHIAPYREWIDYMIYAYSG